MSTWMSCPISLVGDHEIDGQVAKEVICDLLTFACDLLSVTIVKVEGVYETEELSTLTFSK